MKSSIVEVVMKSSIVINRSRQRIIFAAASLLLAGSAQAFVVTLNSLERSIDVYDTDGFFGQSDEVIYTSTGSWADSLQLQVSGQAAADLTSSFVPDSGSYTVYQLSMAGLLSADSSNEATVAGATIDLNVTFDQAVMLDLACSETSDVQVAGFAGTDIGIGPGPVADVILSCGNSLVLSAGTYDINFGSKAVTTFGGLASLDFDNTLTVTAVPVPAAVWLFGSGLGLLGWIRRRKTV